MEGIRERVTSLGEAMTNAETEEEKVGCPRDGGALEAEGGKVGGI